MAVWLGDHMAGRRVTRFAAESAEHAVHGGGCAAGGKNRTASTG